jgi:hypothetical protein
MCGAHLSSAERPSRDSSPGLAGFGSPVASDRPPPHPQPLEEHCGRVLRPQTQPVLVFKNIAFQFVFQRSWQLDFKGRFRRGQLHRSRPSAPPTPSLPRRLHHLSHENGSRGAGGAMFGLRGETRTIAEPLYSPRSVPPSSRRPIERHCARRRALARYTLVCELGCELRMRWAEAV